MHIFDVVQRKSLADEHDATVIVGRTVVVDANGDKVGNEK